MKMTHYNLATISLLVVAFSAPAAWSQTSPTDLAELSLSDLLNVEVTQEAANTPKWFLTYRYVQKEFEGYRDGTENLSFEEMLTLYPVVPTEIRQQASLFELGRRVHRRVMINVLVPIIEQSTDHIRRAGADFNITTRGVGDLRVSSGLELRKGMTLTLGVSLPTGSIDELGDTPRGLNTQVPYTMQTGSGTWSIEPGWTLARNFGRYSWSTQVRGVVRLGRNDRNYSLGDRLLLMTRISRPSAQRYEPWAKLAFEAWGRIDGEDSVLDPLIAPVADARLSGGERLDLSGGLRIALGESRRHHLEIEGGAPLYQNLNGPQPKRLWEIIVGWRTSL